MADPRASCFSSGNETNEANEMPAQSAKLVAVIRALDGTWHRPFTTLELAALQGLVDPEDHLELEGLSDSAWRERIGNAVPPPAAQAIAEVMGQTLLLSWAGETFVLNAMPIWVRPVAMALSVSPGVKDQ
ncbi:DNA cytosine methyltransferase [Acidithiobacillus ferrooxidans]|uniref:DNA cytosine methyltransferase n=1 Tax=Acidithiobacillus ferrooxidans TaxID=920 RepID=UPI003559261B